MIDIRDIVTKHNYYLWKDAKIHFVYDKTMNGFCLLAAEGKADDLFIPNTINGILVKDIYGEEFYEGCNSFNRIIVSDDNKQFKIIDDVLFSYDEKKLILYPPKKQERLYIVPKTVVTVCPRAFSSNCYIENIEFQEGVKTIEMYALCWCKRLEIIKLPHSIREIGSKVFMGLDNLTRVIYNGRQEEWNSVSVSDDNNTDITPLLQYLQP